NKRVRHSAAGQRDIFEAFIAEISLADIDAVVVLGKRSVVAVVSKRDVRRAIIGVGFQANSEEPVVCQDSAQSETQTITLTLALLPIVVTGHSIRRAGQRRIVVRLTPVVLVTETDVAVELDFGDRCGEFPFSAGSRGGFFC